MDSLISIHVSLIRGGRRHHTRVRTQDARGPGTPTRIVSTRRIRSVPTGTSRAPVYRRDVRRNPIMYPREMARERYDLPDVNAFALTKIARIHRDPPLVNQHEPESPSSEEDLPVGEVDGACRGEVRCEGDVPAVARHPLVTTGRVN